MSQGSSIEWTDATWNPVRGCSRVSEGCRNCYAERVAARFSGSSPSGIMRAAGRPQKVGEVSPPFAGFAYSTKAGPRWTGRVELIPSKLDEPLRWKKPRRIFVNSMSDLFHERLSDEAIAAVFGVMAACPQHTFQVLTKRPERMRKWFGWAGALNSTEGWLQVYAAREIGGRSETVSRLGRNWIGGWPLPNVWLGVSVEDQATADERIPLLLQTPAAVRFVSYEPALAVANFERFLAGTGGNDGKTPVRRTEGRGLTTSGVPEPNAYPHYTDYASGPRHGLDWLIVGGESGPGARPFNVAWARSAVTQCKGAGVPVFVKQLGARPFLTHDHGGSGSLNEIRCQGAGSHVGGFCHHSLNLHDRKGGDPAEWPWDLRVRQFPGGAA